MNSFASTIAAGLDAVRKATGTCITYHRGDSWVKTSATQGKTTFECIDSVGTVIKVRSVDFILTAADLVIDDETITPKRGDKIKMPIAQGKLNVFEVMRPDGGDDVWRFMDPACSSVRVHTRLVGTEDED